MNEIQENINKSMKEAQRIRDELALKANLGAADAGDELSKLNDRYELFKTQSKKIFDVAGDSADELKIAAEMGINAKSKEDVLTALELAAEELKYSYQKMQNFVY
jgi:CRISPR/Cas system CSM-associated protein Csm2 small subunit